MWSVRRICVNDCYIIIDISFYQIALLLDFVTDARQILLQTMEILAEPNNPARDLLASALKVLDKAQHTTKEEVKK